MYSIFIIIIKWTVQATWAHRSTPHRTTHNVISCVSTVVHRLNSTCENRVKLTGAKTERGREEENKGKLQLHKNAFSAFSEQLGIFIYFHICTIFWTILMAMIRIVISERFHYTLNAHIYRHVGLLDGRIQRNACLFWFLGCFSHEFFTNIHTHFKYTYSCTHRERERFVF